MPKESGVSVSVIKRLPRYRRFLGDLLTNGVHRISSGELATKMGLTSSQIRQDFNCFGGFGQQGYGYNVEALYHEIGRILGLSNNIPAILIGCGNLGRAVASHINFNERGFHLLGIFDSNPAIIGRSINGYPIMHIDTVTEFCKEKRPRMAILCLPNQEARKLAQPLIDLGITAFWNFSHFDIKMMQNPNIVVENVHLSDSLMTLSYMVNEQKNKKIK